MFFLIKRSTGKWQFFFYLSDGKLKSATWPTERCGVLPKSLQRGAGATAISRCKIDYQQAADQSNASLRDLRRLALMKDEHCVGF